MSCELAEARRTAPNEPRSRGSRPRPGRWALVHVCNGATLTRFDAEGGAREALIGIGHDEVVVLYVAT
jgi:hypothetical protein